LYHYLDIRARAPAPPAVAPALPGPRPPR